MGLTREEIAAKFREPFPDDEVEFRPGTVTKSREKALVFAYPTARGAQRRLDETVGVFNWQAKIENPQNGSYLAGLGVRDPETGEWIWKWNGASATDIEPVKGGISDALKRVAANGWGIGAYFYDLSDIWVDVIPDDKMTKENRYNGDYIRFETGKGPDKFVGYFKRPVLPAKYRQGKPEKESLKAEPETKSESKPESKTVKPEEQKVMPTGEWKGVVVKNAGELMKALIADKQVTSPNQNMPLIKEVQKLANAKTPFADIMKVVSDMEFEAAKKRTGAVERVGEAPF